MKMTMTATGDTILIQGFPEEGYPGLQKIRSYIAKGQARFGNLETCVTQWQAYPNFFSGGTWMNTEPRVLDQILSYGMNFMGFANNHTMDFGPDGLLETVKNVKERGVALAGAGENLYEAEKPVFRDFPGGRVAFIALTSDGGNSRAGYPSKSIKGRPGANGFKSSAKVAVKQEDFDLLREIAQSTNLNARDDIRRENGFAPPLPEGVLQFGAMTFVVTEGEEEKRTFCNQADLKRVQGLIQDALYIADYVVVMFHGHEIKGLENNHPADFHHELARACIDAGASAFLGGGTHELKPLEIYKGKPIFYSLGNFCFQSNLVERQGSDMLDKYGITNTSDIQALAMRNKDWTIGQHTQVQNFRTVIPYMEFEDGAMTHLELLPVDLGFEKSRTFKGIPYPSEKAIATEIFATLSELSEPYGTKMSQEADGIIKIQLD